MQRIISKRLVTVAAMVAMVLTIAVPTFAQVLPQSDPEVTNPAAGEKSVPNKEDVTSTEPSSSTGDGALPTTNTTTDATNDPAAPAEDSEKQDVIPIKLSSELCADVTDPLVVGTFKQVLPEVVQGCQERASIPAGTAPVNPAPVGSAPTNDTLPAEPAAVEPASIDTNPPNQATSVYP
jgi:hypothetical protein